MVLPARSGRSFSQSAVWRDQGGGVAYIEDISASDSTTKVSPNQLTRNMMMIPPVPPLESARVDVLRSVLARGFIGRKA